MTFYDQLFMILALISLISLNMIFRHSEGKVNLKHPYNSPIPVILSGQPSFYDQLFKIYEFGLISVLITFN